MRLPHVDSHLELLLLAQVREAGLPEPVRQHQLVPGRRFRADLAWPARRLYAECDGGTWTRGRHARGSGIERDCEKTSLAGAAGWRLVRVTAAQVEDGRAVAWIAAALAQEDAA